MTAIYIVGIVALGVVGFALFGVRRPEPTKPIEIDRAPEADAVSALHVEAIGEQHQKRAAEVDAATESDDVAGLVTQRMNRRRR